MKRRYSSLLLTIMFAFLCILIPWTTSSASDDITNPTPVREYEAVVGTFKKTYHQVNYKFTAPRTCVYDIYILNAPTNPTPFQRVHYSYNNVHYGNNGNTPLGYFKSVFLREGQEMGVHMLNWNVPVRAVTHYYGNFSFMVVPNYTRILVNQD